MKAYKYKVTISIDAVHSWGDREIEEIWIPKHNICFNEENGCFDSDKPRNKKYEKIEIDRNDAYDLIVYVTEKEYMESICNKYFQGGKK